MRNLRTYRTFESKVEIVKKIESIGDYKLMGGLDQSQKNRRDHPTIPFG